MLQKIRQLKEFDNHRSVIFFNNEKSGLSAVIAFHRTNPNIPSFGATRKLDYESEEHAVRDALRLSKMMSYKSALAGLKYGGAKGVIFGKGTNRKELLKAYAQGVDSLFGGFVTGTDVGLSSDDIKHMKRFSRHFVGTKVDPARFTALGLFYGVQTCLREVFGDINLNGKSFAIQGAGKTGLEFLKLAYPSAGKIYISDVDKKVLSYVKESFPEVIITPPNEIHKCDVDFYCPCALNGAINSKTINELRCKVVAGTANNQLENEEMGTALFKKGILYAPDYVVNAGGLISVVDEYENGNSRVRRLENKIKIINKTLKKIITESKKQNKPTNFIANKMAEEIIKNYE